LDFIPYIARSAVQVDYFVLRFAGVLNIRGELADGGGCSVACFFDIPVVGTMKIVELHLSPSLCFLFISATFPLFWLKPPNRWTVTQTDWGVISSTVHL